MHVHGRVNKDGRQPRQQRIQYTPRSRSILSFDKLARTKGGILLETRTSDPSIVKMSLGKKRTPVQAPGPL